MWNIVLGVLVSPFVLAAGVISICFVLGGIKTAIQILKK